MMMAIAPENRGGFRPTAPQNNPMNINPMGGNGQSGMNTDYTGFAYGQNKAVNQQRVEGNAAVTASEQQQTPAAPVAVNPMDSLLGSLVPLDAPTQDNLPISDGVDIGRGRGSEALPARLTSPINQSQDLDLIKKYLPDLLNATRLPGAPDSYKRFINYLKAQIL
jgi:hypothetical protein